MMRLFRQQHEFYFGVDLHTITLGETMKNWGMFFRKQTMREFLHSWRRVVSPDLQNWTMFYLVTTCICIMICGVSSYAINRANQGLVTIPVVVANVEFQNIMTAKYIVGDQQYEHREKVSPKYARPIGSTLFLRYDVSSPTYARFTIYSAPWVEVTVT
ncbi:MAG: hypothetical protein U0941_28065 [Planctomycetaceae bacterium]